MGINLEAVDSPSKFVTGVFVGAVGTLCKFESSKRHRYIQRTNDIFWSGWAACNVVSITMESICVYRKWKPPKTFDFERLRNPVVERYRSMVNVRQMADHLIWLQTERSAHKPLKCATLFRARQIQSTNGTCNNHPSSQCCKSDCAICMKDH